MSKLVWKTKAMKNLLGYIEKEFNEVKHTTLNPCGLGAVRIHLVPPKNPTDLAGSCVAIINGSDIIPVNYFWAVILCELINQINVYDGQEVGENEKNLIIDKTATTIVKMMRLGFIWIYSKKQIIQIIKTLYETFTQIAYRQEVTADVQRLSIGEYASFMKAPHRMDVMVSAMTKDGKWHCNQKCVHCYAAGQRLSDEEELSTEDWKKVLDKCREIGIPQITFTGGEPTMREDLIELVSYAKWFISRINTNGIKLTKDYCAKLKEAEVDGVQITYYSCDADIHNQLVGAKQHKNTTAGIDNALEAGLSISINTPLCSLNKDYVKTLEYLHSKGVVYVTCSGMIVTGNATTEESQALQLSSEELEQILRDAVKYCSENGMEIAFTSPGWISSSVMDELGLASPTCGACLSNMAITPGGNVIPCQSWLSDIPLGNILTNDWDSIWNGSYCIKRRNFSAEMSGTCPLRRSC